MAGKRWTTEEEDYIRTHKDTKTYREMAKHLGRTMDSVKARTQVMFPKSEVGGIWTQERVDFLKQHGDSMPALEIAQQLGMKYPTVHKKLQQLGLSYWDATGERWNEYEEQYLKDHHHKKTYNLIARHLGRTTSSVQQKAISLGIHKSRNYDRWTKEELDDLKQSIENGDFRPAELAYSMDRTEQAIRHKALELGLLKSKEEIAYTKLSKEKELFIIENADKMTDIELAQMLNVSEKAVAESRKRNGIFKYGGLQKGESQLQLKIKELIEGMGYEFIHNQPHGEFIPDFINHDKKIIIEVNGDYWHCNPMKYTSPKDDKQIRNIVSDYSKKCFYLSNGYMFITLWEDDILSRYSTVVENLKQMLSAVFDRNVGDHERAKSVDSFNW